MEDAATTRVNEIALATPLAVTIQIGLVRLLESWGVTPTAVTSHSSGEIAAAYAAGALTLKTAMAISFARGQLAGRKIEGMRKGGMIAVGLGAEDARKYCSRVTSGQVMVACLNSPSSTTVSGDVSAVEELEVLLKSDNVFARRLKIDAAYHSHHMQALATPYLAWLETLFKGDGHMDENVIFSSPTTGKRETSGKMISSPQHWVTSLVQPVQFVESFKNMCFEDSTSTTSSVDVVIEIGAHAALSGPIQEIAALPDFKGCKITYFPTLVRKSSAVDTMQALACDLIKSGHPLNMNSVNFPFGRHGVQVLTDLPRYPWNHQIRHWSEPRINKAHRHRIEGPHHLLGSLVLGTNMITPSWRHIVRLSDLPWLRDHVVLSNILYPGAGYICMAIEAAHQAAQTENKRILGYQLRDIDIQQGLVIPDTTEGVEVQLTLRPCSDKAIFAKGWKEFQVFSVSGENKWTEHCKGLIQVDVTAADDNQARWSGSASATSQLAGQGEAADYRKCIDPKDVYASMRSVGICHGPIFQNMKNIRASSRQSVVDISVADTAATMPYHHQHEHVIDPTTLDSLFQAAYAAYFALPEIGGKLSYSLVPRSIGKLYVAANIGRDAGHSFNAYCDTNRATPQGFDTDIVVVSANGTKESVMKIDNFVTTSAGSLLSQQTNAYEIEKLATLKWAPDLSFTDSKYLKQQLSSPLDPVEAETMMDLRHVTTHFINDTLAALKPADVAQLEWHHKKFYVWMKLQSALASLNELGPDSAEWINDSAEVKAALAEKVKSASVNGEMVCHLGPRIMSMLRREVTPLELMLEGKLLHKYYLEAMKWDRSSRKVGEMVKHFAHKNPRAKILEIGAGTGGTTTHVLNALGTDDSGVGPLATSYDFTDISSGFFEAAQEKFKDWESLLRYKKLDIEQDPTKQGFENGSYDLIIACQVLHATKNMEHTMTNVRKLLKPGGKLVLFETTKDPQDLLLVFGLLPGWWLSIFHSS
jgi:acyl transferase domain-containing protein/2-polyprenyl-3-methyl-5-hydroxy-6-metoxy-1,4-benzoquinol methylase